MADIYRFLAQAMQYPEPAWFDADFLSAFLVLLQALDDRQEEAGQLESSLALLSSDLTPLQIEYTRLFINAVPHVVAPPYGSVYLSKDGLLYGKSAENTLAFYRQCGYDLAAENDFPDHISHELEFLALLSENGESEAEETFLDRFFRPWFQHFRKRVLEEGQHPYYRLLVELIDFFTREEQEDGM